jgi:pyruvate,water dikinase
VDKVSWQISRPTLRQDRITSAPVGEAPCLTESEVLRVAKIARRVEELRNRPQDIEWAIDPLLPEDANVVLLQARPETSWSRRPQIAGPAETDTFRSITAALMRHPT